MPDKKPRNGVEPKEERRYEHVKESAEKSGHYGDRAEEVAARTVMKHHKEEATRRANSTSCSAHVRSNPALTPC